MASRKIDGKRGKSLKLLPGVPGTKFSGSFLDIVDKSDAFDYVPVKPISVVKPEPTLVGDIWKTKEGQLIPIAEMGDSHLSNAILMLQRSIDTAHMLVKLREKTRDKLKLEESRRSIERAKQAAETAAMLKAIDIARTNMVQKTQTKPKVREGRKFREE